MKWDVNLSTRVDTGYSGIVFSFPEVMQFKL